MREAALNFLPEAIQSHLKVDFFGAGPAKERSAELSPVALVALAAERLRGELPVALGWIGLGDNDAPRHQQRGQGAVKRPQDKSSVPG